MISTEEKQKYLGHVAKRVKRARVVSGVLVSLPFVLILLAVLEFTVVKYRLFGVPDDTARYLLDTGPWKFDYEEFTALPGTRNLSRTAKLWLVGLYYSYMTFLFLAAPASVAPPVRTVALLRRRRGDPHQDFYLAQKLHESLMELARHPAGKTKRRALRTVRSLDLEAAASPLKNNWQKSPSLMWFKVNPLSTTAIRILGTLKAFKAKAIGCIQNSRDLDKLATAVDHLATFFCLSALAIEQTYHVAGAKLDVEERVTALSSFAGAMARIQLRRAPRHRPIAEVYERVADFLVTSFVTRDVMIFGSLAVISGVFAVFGSVVFNIPKGTAFLAWFSVVFGSITISVGISAIGSRRDRQG